MNLSSLSVGIAIGVFLSNSAYLITGIYVKEHKRCVWCNEKYKASKSTSKFKNTLCSMKCEYFYLVGVLIDRGVPLNTAVSAVNSDQRYSMFTSVRGVH